MKKNHLLTKRIILQTGMVLCLAAMPFSAYALAIAEVQPLSFGQLVVPGSGAVVEIDPTGAITSGSMWAVPASGADNGDYQFTGAPGNVDIYITNANACPTATISNFSAVFMGVNYADISTTGIAAVAFDGDEHMRIGARLSYSGTTPLGACTINFDLNIVYS